MNEIVEQSDDEVICDHRAVEIANKPQLKGSFRSLYLIGMQTAGHHLARSVGKSGIGRLTQVKNVF